MSSLGSRCLAAYDQNAAQKHCNWLGLSQDWGAGGDRHWRVWIVGWLESLSEAGLERAIIDGAPNLEQQVGAASRPAHLL